MIGDDKKAWWATPEHERIVELVREIGVWRLGNFDACVCSRFSIRSVEVEINCGKARPRGVRISSVAMDYWNGSSEDGNNEILLRPIAEEVARQVAESDGRGAVPIFFPMNES